jgi:hypothetical protein
MGNKFIVTYCKNSAEFYLQNIFPLHSEGIVISADSSYPISTELRGYALAMISSLESRFCVFGADLIRRMNIRPEQCFIFDELILNSIHRNDYLHLLGFSKNEEIASIVRCFFNQSKLLSYSNGTGALRFFNDYEIEKSQLAKGFY